MLDRLDHPQVLDLGLHRLFKRHDNINVGCQNEATILDHHGAEEVNTHKNLHRHSHHTWLELYQILPKKLSYDYYNIRDTYHHDLHIEQHEDEEEENQAHDGLENNNNNNNNNNSKNNNNNNSSSSSSGGGSGDSSSSKKKKKKKKKEEE